MEVGDDFKCFAKFRCWEPGGFVLGTFVSGPLDKVLELTLVTLVDLGVKDFGDLVFGFTINDDGRLWWCDSIWEVVWS